MLRKKFHTGVIQAIKHDRLLREFNKVLDYERPGMRETWEQMVVAWESNYDGPCPYVVRKNGKYSIRRYR